MGEHKTNPPPFEKLTLRSALRIGICVAALMASPAIHPASAQAQPQAGSTQVEAAPQPLGEQELQVLVARIALYPDELVAVISAASLYPLQIVEAERFLEAHEKDPKLQPKSTWDGSVIALLNYPQIVRMMSEDLDWTQALGEALANQQKDVLVAIQQLRDQAVATGVIKSDDKIKVTTENDNVVIQSANPEQIYIPQYPPEMLYQPGYALAPITYYSDPYPSYFWPTATFFTGAVIGSVWVATVNWNNWGVWGGRWRGDVDVNCNNCFNNRNFNGPININNVDWKNVDRNKISVDRNQINKIDRTNIRNNLEANSANNLKTRAADIQRSNLAAPRAGQIKDVRQNTLDGLKGSAGNRPAATPRAGGAARPGDGSAPAKAGAAPRPGGAKASGKVDRPVGAPRPGGKVDNRPKAPPGLGEVRQGRDAQLHSARGAQGRGGGMTGAPPRRPTPHGGGGHGGGGHGGGRRR